MATLTMPTSPTNFRTSAFWIESNTLIHQSPLTRSTTTIATTGDRWFARYDLQNMLRAQAAAWQAFLADLRGQEGRFFGFDPDGKTPIGTWAGTPLVNGASQTGFSLILDAFTAAATVKKGDYFTVNGELKMITADGTADGSGNLTVTFTPSLRASPANNAAITKTNATCTMMLIDNAQARWEVDAIGVYSISFSGVEVFV